MNQLEAQACTAVVVSAMRPTSKLCSVTQGSFELLEKFLQWQSQIWFDHSRTETQASSVPASGLNNGESGAMAKSTMNGTGMMPIRKRNPLTFGSLHGPSCHLPACVTAPQNRCCADWQPRASSTAEAGSGFLPCRKQLPAVSQLEASFLCQPPTTKAPN
jgi:hypothetical protein